MFKLFQLFRKSKPPAPKPVVVATPVARAQPVAVPTAVPRVVARAVPDNVPRVAQVETASLSLAAIISRFPPELKEMVAIPPGPDAMVALPLSIVLKQLPGGSVKMSLASIHRQAPAGTFAAGLPEDKRMVDVPLGEIFKRVKPELLKRRTDQRMHELADEDGIDVFGDPENPFAVAPSEGNPAAAPRVAKSPTPTLTPAPALAARPAPARPAPAATPRPAPAGIPGPKVEGMRSAAPPPGFTAAAKVPAPAESAPGEAVLLAVSELSRDWPEGVLSELGSAEGLTITLPADEVRAGLAKGRVAFTWAQLRSWVSPALSGAGEVDGATVLSLPLRVIAPAFLKDSKPSTARKRVSVTEDIPALFNAAAGTVPVAPVSIPGPTIPEPEPPAPAIPVPELALGSQAPIPAPASIPGPQIPARIPARIPAPAAEIPPFALPKEPVAPVKLTIGAILGQPEKDSWSPSEVVSGLSSLESVAGAVVALKEGLVVAHSLPDTIKADVVSAFLPQIFGRLNQYCGEMKLAEVEELNIRAGNASLKMYRLGAIFFAVLSKEGQSLPEPELRVLANELMAHAQR